MLTDNAFTIRNMSLQYKAPPGTRAGLLELPGITCGDIAPPLHMIKVGVGDALVSGTLVAGGISFASRTPALKSPLHHVLRILQSGNKGKGGAITPLVFIASATGGSAVKLLHLKQIMV